MSLHHANLVHELVDPFLNELCFYAQEFVDDFEKRKDIIWDDQGELESIRNQLKGVHHAPDKLHRK
jgi:hypothetical protein